MTNASHSGGPLSLRLLPQDPHMQSCMYGSTAHPMTHPMSRCVVCEQDLDRSSDKPAVPRDYIFNLSPNDDDA